MVFDLTGMAVAQEIPTAPSLPPSKRTSSTRQHHTPRDRGPHNRGRAAEGSALRCRCVCSSAHGRCRWQNRRPHAGCAAPAEAERVAVTRRITKRAAVPVQDTFAAQTAPAQWRWTTRALWRAPRPREPDEAMAREKVASVAEETALNALLSVNGKPLSPYPKDWTAPTLNAREQSIVANAEALEANADWSGAHAQGIPTGDSTP